MRFSIAHNDSAIIPTPTPVLPKVEWKSEIDEDGDFSIYARVVGNENWVNIAYVSVKTGKLTTRYAGTNALIRLGLEEDGDVFGAIATD